MNLTYLFKKSPIFIKQIMLNTKALLNYNIRYSGNFYQEFEKLNNLWYQPSNLILEYQKKELTNFLIECFQYSDWYKKKFEELQIDEAKINTDPYFVLKKLPILKKSERKKFVDKIVNKNPKRKIIGVGHTSGTSGSPTINYVDKASVTVSFAFWKRFHYMIGFNNIHPKTVRFSGNIVIPITSVKPPFWLYNIFEKQLYMSTYHMSNENIPNYIKKLNQFKPTLLDGYPSAIYNLANYINTHKIELSFVPKAIATTSETLYDEQRIVIEKAFKCKIFNQYASSEGSPFITECLKGNLHLNLDSGVFELLNENYELAKPGEIAKLVVTSFRNYKTPLIRYDIQDSVLIPETNIICDCGCEMPIIKKIMGREDDLLVASNGSLIGMSAYKVFKHANHIIRGQIIQKNKTDFILNVEVTEKFGKKDILFLENKVKESFGFNSKIKVNIVKSIPLGPNGKFKSVIREFKL